MDPEARDQLHNAAVLLAERALQITQWKLDRLASLQVELGDGAASEYARRRLEDDRQFLGECVAELNSLVEDGSISAYELADRTLARLLRMNVHPSQVQQELLSLEEAIRYFDQTLARVARQKTDEGLTWLKEFGSKMKDAWDQEKG
jgi:hypothetical protein